MILEQYKELSTFIKIVRLKRNNAEPLKAGFRIDLDSSEQRMAQEMNFLYSKLVWGIKKSAVNTIICDDEKNIIDGFINYHDKVLEVGCGSGRITNYLSKKCLNLTVIDYVDNVGAIVLPMLESQQMFYAVNYLDFTQGGYDKILLLENFTGMFLERQNRIDIYKKTSQLLDEKGIAVFGLRICEDIKQGFFYQCFPYRPRYQNKYLSLFGAVINWSVNFFMKELELSKSGLEILEIRQGGSRAAGGDMYYAITRKSGTQQ